MVSASMPRMRRDITHGDAAKRAFDIIVSSVALVVASPFMILLAIAIICESGRPIFFSQKRLGLGGRPFRMYKFRKFHKDCGTSGSPLTLEHDLRLTRIGKLLLATKMDELPQFWNVLKGDMSIIGPRPESMAFADCFSAGFERVLHYKPGILGPAQTAFRSECTLYPSGVDPTEFYRAVLFPAKAQIDLDYYSSRTFFSDIMWLLRGALAVLGISKSLQVSSSKLADLNEGFRTEVQVFVGPKTIGEHSERAKA